VFGVVTPGMASVVSSHLLGEIDNARRRRLALGHAVAHFFGRMSAIPRHRGRSDVVTHDGALLCTNNCAMRPLPATDTLLAYALQEREAGSMFCEPCQLDLLAQLTGFHYGLN
jgi:hypothetical protein